MKKKTGIFCHRTEDAGFLHAVLLFLFGRELILSDAAHRTLEIIRKIRKFCAGSDACIGIAEIFVINIAAYVTYKFCHCKTSKSK